jgi:hypothetical protein|tara:strand:+ start:2726 stop:3115 length:390 start_codon:yes stop_codon:yes gene_type:complete
MATEKQKKAVERIVENHGNVSKSMREAGYTDASAKNPKNLTESDGYKEITQNVVERMIIERDRALGMMAEKIADAKYRDMSDSTDKLTKNIQLLTGGDTDRGRISVFEVPTSLAKKNAINTIPRPDSAK